MALITEAEAQTIWDNRTNSCKCYDSETKNASTYKVYGFSSSLDGCLYLLNTSIDNFTVTSASSAATVETNVKAFLETQTKKVAVLSSGSNV